jgi:hypothetical protein
MLAASFQLDNAVPLLRFWASLTIFTGMTPPSMLLWSRLRTARAAGRVGDVAGVGLAGGLETAVLVEEHEHRREHEHEHESEAVAVSVPVQAGGGVATEAWAE